MIGYWALFCRGLVKDYCEETENPNFYAAMISNLSGSNWNNAVKCLLPIYFH
jgi:hypothetical protein